MRKPLAAWVRRTIGLCLIGSFAAPLGGAVKAQQQQSTQATAPAGQTEPQTVTPAPDAPAPQSDQTGVNAPPTGSQNSQQSESSQQPPKSQTGAPVGTAVAPYEKGIGVAASRPAGAVIAPAKQKRTRSFVIKVGLLVGAAAAIGTVVALSNASPSRPH